LVKSRFFEDKDVAATSIGVETLNGTVMLSGFAKSNMERNKAETIARGVRGVKSVKNEISVRP
jgi:osmotically-inducible protein OsmY